MYSREEILNLLHKGIVRVVFNKVSTGEERVMFATLLAEHIPMDNQASLAPGRKLSEETIRAYDIEKSAWRSFRIDSVTDVGENV